MDRMREELQTQDEAPAEYYQRVRTPRIYKPLDAARRGIRLLIIKPGHRVDFVRCTLRHAYLDDPDKPPYETISYVWGDPSLRTVIEIDGQLVSVPQSSARALECMRQDRDRVLWIDAVCIDQSNDQERSQQVGLMAEIYTGATCCLAYVGSIDGNDGDAVAETLNTLREYAPKDADGIDLDALRPGSRDTQLAPLNLACSVDAMDAVCRLLRNPWFRRLWVLQEVALSPRTVLHFEGATVEISHLFQVYEFLTLDIYRDLGEWGRIISSSNARNLGLMAVLRRKPYTEPALHDLLFVGAHYEVTDPRDRVYAVLGIFQRGRGAKGLPRCLIPDYSKNDEQVLLEATYYAINESRKLDLWHEQRCLAEDSSTVRVPSWVPLLRTLYPEGNKPMSFPFPNTYGADGARDRPPDDRDPASMALTVEGCVIDTVCARTTSLSFQEFEHEGLQFIRRTIGLFVERIQSSSVRLEDLEQTLVAGEQKQAYRPHPLNAILARLSTTDENATLFPSARPGPQVSRWPGDDVYALDLREYCKNRCFFVTQSGYIGLGPEYLHEGDALVILSGGQWPFALRRTNSDEEQYRLLSSCYVHGVMNGELTGRFGEPDMPWRQFEIV